MATLGYMAPLIILFSKIHGLAGVISLIQNRTENGGSAVFMVAVLSWLKKHIKIAKNPAIFIKRMSNLSKS